MPPPAVVADVLCIHSGWHYTSRRPFVGARPEYVLWHHGYWRTSWTGGWGEAGWRTVNSYGGGLQFTLGTWNGAAALSHGRVPHVRATAVIAALPPSTQILAAWFAWRVRGDWGDWPNTAKACGLR